MAGCGSSTRVRSHQDAQSLGEPDQISEVTRVHGNFLDGEKHDFAVDGKQKTLVVSMVFNNEVGFRKITAERPPRLNFQATDEGNARLDEESGFRNLFTSPDYNILLLHPVVGRLGRSRPRQPSGV